MADRRMFSKNITSSALFLKMPSSSRLLYYDLGMEADDDGVVEAYTVMRKTGATEDDLKVLATKGLIIVLDAENLIVFITNWKENNKLRADRKKDSIYKSLLLEMCPDIKLLEPTKRADLKAKDTMDNQWTSTGPHSVGKCSVGEDSITLHYITQQYYYFLIGKREFFENSTENEKILVIKALKELDIFMDNFQVFENLDSDKQLDFMLQYWSIKELVLSSSKVYFKYLTREIFLEKYLKCCDYKNKHDTKDFLDYFIKTLKNELKELAEKKVI